MKLKTPIVTCWLMAAAALAVTHSAAANTEQKAKTEDLSEIKKSISAGLESGKAGIVVTAVEASPIPGLYKATIGEGPHVYATADGKHFVAGEIYAVSGGKIVNLTDQERNVERAKAMASLDKKDMVVFAPKEKAKKVLYVFTDVDCGYCQLLHSKVPEYNEMGVEIRYLAYPRAGMGSNSSNKMVSAWCAKDPHDALTKLKLRQEIPQNLCADNPVASHFELSRKLGLTGTPAMITESGELIAGYVEPQRLKQMLEL